MSDAAPILFDPEPGSGPDYYRSVAARAREDAASVEAELTEARARVADLESRLTSLRRLEHATSVLAGDRTEPKPPTAVKGWTSARTHGTAAYEVLARADRPLTVKEICAALDESGHPLPRANSRYSAIYSAMRRDLRLVCGTDKRWSVNP